jgi:hypothetical protein
VIESLIINIIIVYIIGGGVPWLCEGRGVWRSEVSRGHHHHGQIHNSDNSVGDTSGGKGFCKGPSTRIPGGLRRF